MNTPRILRIDIETRSRVDLLKSGVYRYVECPDFEILMCAWSDDLENVHLAVGREEIDAIPGLYDSDTFIVAHNANFERICFSAHLGLPVGEYLDPRRFIDTAALAAIYGYPRSLEKSAEALGGPKKDAAGTALIKFFSIPRRDGKFNQPEDDLEKWQQFCDYCVQDVHTMNGIEEQLLPEGEIALPGAEESIYISDQLVNDRGILLDVEMAEAAVESAETNRMVQELRIIKLTGVQNPGSVQQMSSWLATVGVDLPDLKKATVEKFLGSKKLASHPQAELIREVLSLRLELALVASSKYSAALARVNSDGRVRGSFQYFGAHTGRWAGRGVQLQNLPSASLDKDHPRPDELIAQTIVDLKVSGDTTPNELKSLVRSMFVGPYTVVDYSAIEARVLAWLADERWALDAFSAGRDIYVETAERMGQGMTRKEGKVAVLALGYNGGVGSLEAMGAEGSEEQLRFLVNQWRDANPRITRLWPQMEESFKRGGKVGKLMTVHRDGRDRMIELPSGRSLVYHDVRGRKEVDQWGRERIRLTYLDPQKPGFRKDTYGGRLTENVTQAVARDILAEALVRLHASDYQVALHVHDEIGVEGLHPISEITRIMTTGSDWTEGLPLDAEGYHCPRYRKD